MIPISRDNSERPPVYHRVLVVDDEEVMRRMLTRALGGAQCLCESTGTGEKAVELLGMERFDLAVVDKNLPDISGLEVARRALDSVPPVPVIMVTGFPSAESKKTAQTLGVSCYMTKPFGLYQLQRTASLVLSASAPAGATPGVATSDLQPYEQTTEPPPKRGRQRAERAGAGAEPPRADVDVHELLDARFLILEPDDGIRDLVLTILTGEGLQASAFRSRHEAAVHIRHVGYDVLIARTAIIAEDREWARRASDGKPLGTVAILESGAIDKQIDAIQKGCYGVLVPPFEATRVLAELHKAVAFMREQ